MILHSIQIGTHHIHVRTDDCDARELERVHETVRLVERMLNRHGNEAFALIIGLVVFFGSMAITLSTMSPGPAQTIISLVVCVIVSAVSWQLLAHNVHQRQRADATHLQMFTTVSTRCRDFVVECAEASPALSRVLSYSVERSQTA